MLTTCFYCNAGYFVEQDIVNRTAVVSEPLPCISNWIILMQRLNRSVDFNQNWITYKNGFGDIRGTDFWIVNEKMHLITNSTEVTYRLGVEVAYSYFLSQLLFLSYVEGTS